MMSRVTSCLPSFSSSHLMISSFFKLEVMKKIILEQLTEIVLPGFFTDHSPVRERGEGEERQERQERQDREGERGWMVG